MIQQSPRPHLQDLYISVIAWGRRVENVGSEVTRCSPPSQNGYGFFGADTLLASAFRSLDRGDFGRGADMMGEGDAT